MRGDHSFLTTETLTFPPTEISIKLAITIGIGMLVGLEREWSQKDLGTRTFAITAMIGTLSMLAGPPFAYVSLAGILLVVLLTGLHNLRNGRAVETTTSVALILTFVIGALVGEGHHYTPIAAAIVMTMLLSLKPALTTFAGGLQMKEVRSAVLLGLIGFVIYPVLPNRAIDPWQLVNPQEAWLTVLVIAILGFVNYVLLKIYSARGLYYTAVLGGLVNSTATIAELAQFLKGEADQIIGLALTIDLLTVVAMFLRNLVILAIFAQDAVATAIGPLLLMASVSGLLIWFERKRVTSRIGSLNLSSPLSLAKVLKFGLLFLVIQILSNLGQRYLGQFGFLLVSVIGGLASSASTAAAAATLAMHGKVTPEMAGIATILTSMASALSNLPLLHQQVRDWKVTRKLVVLSLAVLAAGAAATMVAVRLQGN